MFNSAERADSILARFRYLLFEEQRVTAKRVEGFNRDKSTTQLILFIICFLANIKPFSPLTAFQDEHSNMKLNSYLCYIFIECWAMVARNYFQFKWAFFFGNKCICVLMIDMKE